MILRVTGARYGCSPQCVYTKNKKEKDTKEKTAHMPAVEDSLYITGRSISQPLTSTVLKTPRYREIPCCYEVEIQAESEGSVFKLNPHFINQIDFLHMQYNVGIGYYFFSIFQEYLTNFMLPLGQKINEHH